MPPKVVKLSTQHPLHGTATYSCKVVRVCDDGTFWVEIPKRVRDRLKAAGWPLPLNGKQFGQFSQSLFQEFV
jgi:hypothetical protein